MSEPSYYLWHPSLESQGKVVSILMSRALRQRAPELGREFFEGVLAKTGIPVGLVAWGVHDFVSAYFQSPRKSIEDMEWQECWETLLLVNRTVSASELHEMIAVPLELIPEKEYEPHSRIPLRVIANFPTKKQAKQCVMELKKHALESVNWPSGVYGYELRRGPRHGQQLWVDVTWVDRIGVHEFAPKGREVMSVCEQMGGSVFSPQRK